MILSNPGATKSGQTPEAPPEAGEEGEGGCGRGEAGRCATAHHPHQPASGHHQGEVPIRKVLISTEWVKKPIPRLRELATLCLEPATR